MKWAEIKYKRGEVDRAGDVLINGGSSAIDIDRAIIILDNWRSSHGFPLHIFKKRLKEVSASLDARALVVQRRKRTPAILKKLQRKYEGRHPTMKLSQMQDIGGCRSVLQNLELVKILCNEHYHIDKNTRGKHCNLKHEFKQKKDYISNPKSDGYRSIHLIYKYKSDKTKKYNGLLIEIQVRSKLQHIWATAVETVGHFTKQALKSNEGEQGWLEFFKLVSSVFANIEKTPVVPGTPTNKRDLYKKILDLSDQLQAINKIENWAHLLNIIGRKEQETHHKPHFYLLNLDVDAKTLRVSTFEKKSEENANIAYSEAEKEARKDGLHKDIVLVEAYTTRELQKAYPNYFLDTKEFVSILRNYLKSPPSAN